jgi:SAM-dependent methyltransferase
MSYIFTDRAAEDERLIAQGRLFDPLTRRLFELAGLAPGMRVLDLGSGAGNVARLTADLVGPDGAVVGVEHDPAAVALARRRSDLEGTAAGIEYRVGDAQTLEGVEDGFDAVIGRLILLHVTDPIAALRRAATRVRPGGLICMHEPDLAYFPASPRTPLWSQVHGYFVETLEKAGIDTRMGPSLFTAFRAAGLPEPHLLAETNAGGGPDSPRLGLGKRHLGDGPADGAIRGSHPGRRRPGHARRTVAGRDPRRRRLCLRPPDDRGLGPLADGVTSTLFSAHRLPPEPGMAGAGTACRYGTGFGRSGTMGK